MRRTSDFLGASSTKWVAGPAIPVDMNYPCAVKISSQSFIIIYRTDIHEYEVDITDPTSSSGWQSATKWPQLQTSRESPACNKIDNYLVIAGGYGLRSTELLNLVTRTIENARDLNFPRSYFHLTTIIRKGQQMLLALGEDTVEQFWPNNKTWTVVPTGMKDARIMFGAVVVKKSVICPT